MSQSKILVTGATGFIGTRLCERLSLVHNLPYRALVRNFSRANRIARVQAEMVRGELLDKVALKKAAEGCDIVMHLAHGEDRSAKRETETLVEVCIKAGVKRFVHVSSMAVYGPNPGHKCEHESSAVIGRYGEAYSDSKAAQEAVIKQAVQAGFPAVIVRPTVVYGPYSVFVPPVIAAARSGRVTLIDGGKGICNAVYVDDVCDAIVAASRAEGVLGEAFIINGDDPVTWRDFNLNFAEMVAGQFKLGDLSSDKIRAHWAAQKKGVRYNFRQLASMLASPEFHGQLSRVPAFGATIQWAKRSLASRMTAKQKLQLKLRVGAAGRPVKRKSATATQWPDDGRMVRECYPISLSNAKAKARLGWKPAYSFSDGAELTRSWLKFARMIDS